MKFLSRLGGKANALAGCFEGSADRARPVAMLMLVFVAFYFGELSSFTFSVDEERAAVRNNGVDWLYQGRWTTYLLEQLISQPVLPYFTLLLFGLLASLGYMLLMASFQWPLAGIAPYILFLLFCAFPTLFFIIDFISNVTALGVGMLAGCGAILLFSRLLDRFLAAQASRRDLWNAVAQLLLATAAIGCYQSFALYILFGYAAVFVSRFVALPDVRFKDVVAVHGYMLLLVAVAAAASQFIARAAIGFEAEAYMASFNRVGELLSSPLAVIRQTLANYLAVYLGQRWVYAYEYLNFPLVLLLGGGALLFHNGSHGRGRRAFTLAYLAGMTFIPFGLHLVAGGFLPFRAIVAVPLVFWFFGAAAASSRVAAVRVAGVALAALIGLQSLYTLSTFEASRRLAYQHDVALADEIYNRIALKVDRFDRATRYSVDIFGAHEFNSIYQGALSSTWGESLFQWDDGNAGRMITFMNVIGYSNLRLMSEANRKALLPLMLKMPPWPQEGSVQVFDNKVLVRLGEAPGVTHRDLVPAKPRENVLFELTAATAEKATVRNAKIIAGQPGSLHLAPGDDTMILLSTGRPRELHDCTKLVVRTSILTRDAETAQLFYIPTGGRDFSEENSVKLGISEGNPIEFTISSPRGFEDRLRLDPVFGSAELLMPLLQVVCASPAAPATGPG